MHRIVASSVLLVAAASAFAPTQYQQFPGSQQQRSLHTPLSATKLASLPSIPNPFQQLPWNVVKAQKSKELKLKLERSRLHRELGIAEDATYEEITEATDRMIARADGDLKRKIQIEVTKDKILQIRLNERLAGLMSDIVTKDAKAQSGFEATGYVNVVVCVFDMQCTQTTRGMFHPMYCHFALPLESLHCIANHFVSCH